MLDVKGLTRDASFVTFSTPAQLTAPGLLPITVSIIGPDRRLSEVPAGGEFILGDRQTLISLRRDQVSDIPRGTEIKINGKIWTVDSVGTDDGDVVTVIVR
jgi:hypothetical protein